MKITVNDIEYNVPKEYAETKLSTYLRENLNLTGTKIGCEWNVWKLHCFSKLSTRRSAC
jgi:aerobic-type carbon monoxide dehydrogenase small subunit (CoxS/CutS family)